jgi:hypothetical protein
MDLDPDPQHWSDRDFFLKYSLGTIPLLLNLSIPKGYPGLTKTEDDYMRSMAAAGMDMDVTSGGSGQSVVAHHPQWGAAGAAGGSSGGGGGGGVPVGPPPPTGPPHGARPVPHPLQQPPAATATSNSAAAAAAGITAGHQNGGGVPPMENNLAVSPTVTLQAAAGVGGGTVPHCYATSPATLSYTREEGRGEHWAPPPAPPRIQVNT